MCNPAVIPIVIAAVGAVSETATGAEAANYNVALAAEREKQLEAEAENVRIAGSQEAQAAKIESDRTAARNRAQFAASGVSTATGTPGQVSEDVAAAGMIDQMTIINNANRQAMGLETEAQNIMSQATFQQEQAAKRAKIFGLTPEGKLSLTPFGGL